MIKIYSLLKTPLGIGAIVIVAGAFIILISASSDKAPELIAVERGTISEEVTVTGTLKADSVDLAFEKSGTIKSVLVKIGDTVKAGQPLIELDRSELAAQLNESEAALQAAKARFEKVKNGPRIEEINIQKVKTDNARAALTIAKNELIDAAAEGYAMSDDAVRNKADQLFSESKGVTPKMNFAAAQNFPQLKTDLELERYILEKELIAWSKDIADDPAVADISRIVLESKTTAGRTRDFLSGVSVIVNGSVANVNLAQTTIDSYKSAIASARSSVTSALANFTAKESALLNASANVALESEQLELLLKGSSDEEIAIEQASLSQAEAKVRSVRAQLNKFILRSPIDGIVTREEADLGEIAFSNVPLVTVKSDVPLDIEAYVPEVDIGKISLWNSIKVTVDALPGESFVGRVIQVDPAETVVDGVVNFKVKAILDIPDPRLKSGLTANLSIQTKEKDDTLLLPQFAIIENDKGTFVRRLENNKSVETPVTLGVRSQANLVEILSGLNEGDKVVNVGLK